MDLFQGQDRAYGYYDLSNTTVHEGKKAKGQAKTVHGPVTKSLWIDHIEGRTGLGITPIRDNSKCYFGAIDIDVYSGLKLTNILLKIEEEHLPLIAFRSKSGGVHCYIFFREPVPAPLLRKQLKSFASVIGHGTAEIFPKQNEILAERGDLGQWINMPYFNGDKTDRYAYMTVGDKIKPATMDEFIVMADKLRMSEADLRAFSVVLLSDISDGPPCLQVMAAKGCPEGTRNEALFNMGVYLKKSQPDAWTALLDDYNRQYMDPQLSSQEVMAIQKSVAREDFGYGCDKSPCKDHCDKDLCKTRRWGIGELLSAVQLTSLTKFDSSPPIWFADVEGGGRIELTTEDLQNQARFQRRCMEEINQMPAIMKPASSWQKYIRELLESLTVIEAPDDASPKGILCELLEQFCTNRATAKTRDEIIMGKSWTDKGKHTFRMSDFIGYLERKRFRDFKVNKISSVLREIGGEPHCYRIRNKSVNVWSIPEFAVSTADFETPHIDDKEHF